MKERILNEDEQTRRIREEWAAAVSYGIDKMSWDELEDIFEDRDPAEFL